MQQVSEHVWAEVEYDGANVGFVVGERGVVLVESPMCPGDARDWLGKVRSVTGKETLFIVTTDHHFDHSVCSGMLCPNLVMHETAAAAFQTDVKGHVIELFETYYPMRVDEAKAELDVLESAKPLMAFSDRMVIDLGDVRVSLIHTGGHALGTSLIHVVEDHVLFTGDNATNGRHAYMGQMVLADWQAALDTALSLSPRVVVPGHGDLGDIAAITKMERFFALLGEIAGDAIDDGKSEDETAQLGEPLVEFFPLLPGREEMTVQWVDEALRRCYSQTV